MTDPSSAPVTTATDGDNPTEQDIRTELLLAGVPAALAAQPIDVRRRLPIPYVNVTDAPDGDPGDPRLGLSPSGGPLVPAFDGIFVPRVLEVARDRLCGLCHEPLGYWFAFLGGPATAHHRIYLDPAGHPDCLRAAILGGPPQGLCPHIRLERMRRRPETEQTVTPAGFVSERSPAWVLTFTRDYKITLDRQRGVLLHAAPFKSIEVYGYRQDGTLDPTPRTGSPARLDALVREVQRNT